MKKLATLAALLAGIGFAYSQGSVSFNNNGVAVGGDHDVYNGDPVGGTKLVGTNYVAELYFGAAGTAEASLTPLAASISKFRITSTSSPGTWSGKTVTLPMGGVGNPPIVLEVKVWDITLASSYEQAVAGGLGKVGASGEFTFTQILSSPPATTDNQMVTMPAFAINPVPEPSAIALSVMGVAGLLLIRRRK